MQCRILKLALFKDPAALSAVDACTVLAFMLAPSRYPGAVLAVAAAPAAHPGQKARVR